MKARRGHYSKRQNLYAFTFQAKALTIMCPLHCTTRFFLASGHRDLQEGQ